MSSCNPLLNINIMIAWEYIKAFLPIVKILVVLFGIGYIAVVSVLLLATAICKHC